MKIRLSQLRLVPTFIIFFRIVLIALVSAFREVKSAEKTIQCEAHDWIWGSCVFTNVTFDQDTKLKIERIGAPEATDEDFVEIRFYSSSVSLVHPDILAKFPNIKGIGLGYSGNGLNELTNPEFIENCHNITGLELNSLEDFTGVSRDTFSGCKKLEFLSIRTDTLTDLPDGFFKNQGNLRRLTLEEKNLKLRVSAFEGLKSLSELTLWSMDLSKMEENFFRSLTIERLYYSALFNPELTFPIESLNSQETIEKLSISWTNMSQFPDNFGPTLQSMKKLKTINFSNNLIRSVEVFVDLPNVEKIILWNGNKIEELPANAFKGCPRLSYLYLDDNPIKALRGDEFNQLGGLKYLDLSSTRLTSIAPTTFHPLQSLVSLNLGRSFAGPINIENKLFMNLTNLRTLDLSENNIVAIQRKTFDSLRNLSFLGLQGNICVNEWFEAPYNEVLDMEVINEKLKVCFGNFPAEEVECNFVSLGGKYICYIRGVKLSENQQITITGNHQPGKSDSDVSSVIFIESKLDGIPQVIFSQFENLKELNVESTGLEELNYLGNCGSLESFKAPFNNIVKINDETFKDCKNLRTVDLQSNKIEKLGKTVFKHNQKLWQVNLSRNEINGIEPCGFLSNQPELQSVNFVGNQCISANVYIFNGNFTELEDKLIPCYVAWYSKRLAVLNN